MVLSKTTEEVGYSRPLCSKKLLLPLIQK